MKYLKRFEFQDREFDIGDIVKINTKNSTFNNSEFFHNKIGIIDYVFQNVYNRCKVVLDDNPNDFKAANFNFDELDYASPEEIEQYKMEQDIKKYNL